jgi:hypothetical protein
MIDFSKINWANFSPTAVSSSTKSSKSGTGSQGAVIVPDPSDIDPTPKYKTDPGIGMGVTTPKAAKYTDYPDRINSALMGDITWYRDPSWVVNGENSEEVGGYGVIWDPVFGYQLKDDLMGAMEKALKGRTEENPLTQKEWLTLGSKYGLRSKGLRSSDPWGSGLYTQYTGGSGGGGDSGGGETSDDYWSQLLGDYYNTLSGDASYANIEDSDNTQVWGDYTQYPTQWETASDVLTAFAKHGYPTETPEAWNKAEDVYTSMADTGLPVSQDEWYQNAKKVAQTDISDAIKQSNEQSGLTGTRWSSPLARTNADIAGRRMETLGTSFAEQTAQALENARGRQLEGASGLNTIGSNITGLSEAAKARGLTAAESLKDLGQKYVDYPMNLANQMYEMGTSEQETEQSNIDKILAEYERLMPENSPWLENLKESLGLGSSSVGDYASDSSGSDLMSFLSSLLGSIL